jgi:hypothetical protein
MAGLRRVSSHCGSRGFELGFARFRRPVAVCGAMARRGCRSGRPRRPAGSCTASRLTQHGDEGPLGAVLRQQILDIGALRPLLTEPVADGRDAADQAAGFGIAVVVR